MTTFALLQDLDRPDEEEVAKGLAATRAIIDARVAGTIAAAQPKNIAPQPGAAQFIKYTPAKQGPEFNSGASSRVIQMHEVATDPLEPPKFRHKKVHWDNPKTSAPCHLRLPPVRSPPAPRLTFRSLPFFEAASSRTPTLRSETHNLPPGRPVSLFPFRFPAALAARPCPSCTRPRGL